MFEDEVNGGESSGSAGQLGGDPRKPRAEKRLSVMSVPESELDLLSPLPHDPASVGVKDVLARPTDRSPIGSTPAPSDAPPRAVSDDRLEGTGDAPGSRSGRRPSAGPTPTPADGRGHSAVETAAVHEADRRSSPAPGAPKSRQRCGGHPAGPARLAAHAPSTAPPSQHRQGPEQSSSGSPRGNGTAWPLQSYPGERPRSPAQAAHDDTAPPAQGPGTPAAPSAGKELSRSDQSGGGGLFQILLQDGMANPDGSSHSQTNSNPVSMATADTSGEELTPRGSSPGRQASPRKRRKSSRHALCPDPFAKLPRVKLRPLVWAEDSDDNEEARMCAGSRRRRRASSSATGRSPRRADVFRDPFMELAFILFDSADVDCDKRLRRAELGSILKSPTLELELTADDIRRFEKDCSNGRKDIKDLPVSFDEFLPLARNLLMLHYNKQDIKSRNPWSILERGRDLPPFYFNKQTGEVSADRPFDYDNQPELFLFEKSLQDAFETADLRKDGRLHLDDFIRIIKSEDFGLILTKKDITELTKHFKNEAGKVDKVSYSEFLPLAKRLVVSIFASRDPLPDDWCYLRTRQVGSFWFNKRTGQSFRHPPNHFVTMQQQQLKNRKYEAKVLLKTSEELKVTKALLEEETGQRKDFEEKYTTLSAEHAFTSKELQKTTRLYDKSREESEKKSVQLDANEKEKAKLLHKIEQLEARVAETERTENNLEAMRDVLRNCQGALREHELDILSLRGKTEELSRQLSESEARVEDGKATIADLHQQLREEIKRNEKMEGELKKVPDMQREMAENLESLKLCQKRLEERNAVLTLTRQVNRENKAKLRAMETELGRLPSLQHELELARCEVYTLKQLSAGKDSLVARKSQELDSVRERLEQDRRAGGGDQPPGRGSTRGHYRVVRLQKRGQAKSTQAGNHSPENKSPTNGCGRIDVGTPPYDGSSSSSSQSECKPAKPDPQRVEGSDDTVLATSPNASSNGSFLRFLQQQGNADADVPTIYDLYTPEGSYNAPAALPASPRPKNGTARRPKSSMARLEAGEAGEAGFTLQRGTLMFEDDFMVAQFLQGGDRVRIKKKGGKGAGSILSGVVKFIGKVDKEFHHNDHRLYAGIRLDDAVGDTDGVIKGKRYFTVNPRHGKLVPITDIVSILNQKTSTYKRIAEFARQQQLESGPVRYERSRNAQLIRVM